MFVQNIPNLGYNIIIMTLLNPLYGISGPPDFSVVRLIISDFEFPHLISDPPNPFGFCVSLRVFYLCNVFRYVPFNEESMSDKNKFIHVFIRMSTKH